MKSIPDAHVLIKDSQGFVVHTTLPAQCVGCATRASEMEVVRNCGVAGKRRRGRRDSSDGSVFFCTNDPDLVASTRLFKKELDFLEASIGRLAEYKSDVAKEEAHKSRRLFHNLISLNAHALQELYSVVSQDKLSNSAGYRSQKEFLSTFLRGKNVEMAELFLRALKNAAAVKSELSVFQKLYDPSPSLKFARHEIHRVLVNVANYFFQDFADNQIRLSIEPSEARLLLDYESIQVAFYHVLDNATKYAMPSSDIRVSFTDAADFCVCFEMVSLYVEEHERERIFSDGVSGGQAKRLSRSGQGLGMGLIVDLLKLNDARLQVDWGELVPLAYGMPATSPRYSRNKLSFLFSRRA